MKNDETPLTRTAPPPQLTETAGSLAWLIEIMTCLLGPNGCPWDREQTLQSLRPYLIEECYEVLDAIDGDDPDQHCEELGDLLLQIVFQSQLADIRMERVIRGIGDKLIRRHPHVFADVHVRNSTEVIKNWDAIKATEKAQRGEAPNKSIVDSVPSGLPALHRAHEIARKASKIGVAPPSLDGAQIQLERLQGVDPTAEANPSTDHQAVGDLLLAVAAAATTIGVEPEQALRDALRRYEARLQPTRQEGSG